MNKDIKLNYIASLTYQIINVLVQIILLRYLSVVIGSNGIGIQSFTNSIVLYFTMVSSLGINWLGQKEIAQNLNNKPLLTKIFWQLFFLKFTWSVIVFIAYIVLIISSNLYSIYYIVLIITYIANIIDITWFYQGIEKFGVIALRNTIIKLLGMILVLCLVKNENDVVLYILLISLSTFLGNLSLWINLKKELQKPSLQNMDFRHYIRPAIQYFIPTVATTLYLTMDKTMIGVITGDEYENGYYEQAIQIVNMLKSVVLSYNAVMISRMTYIFSMNKQKEIVDNINMSTQLITYIGWGTIFGLLALHKDFTCLYFGGGNTEINSILLMFTPIILIVGISNMIESHIITPLNQRSTGNKIVLWGAGLNLFINMFTIPMYGAIGAAMSSVLSEIFIMFCYIKHSNKMVLWSTLINVSWRKLIAAIIMYVSICIIKQSFSATYITFLIEIFIGIIIYTIILYMLKDDLVLGFLCKNKQIKKGEN